MATKTPSRPEAPTLSPVEAAQTEYEAAAARAAKLSEEAAKATAVAEEAKRAEMDAIAQRTAATRERDLVYQRATAAVAGQRIQDAGADQTAARIRFTEAVVATEWGAALVDYLSAMQRGRAWDSRHVGALEALGGNPAHARGTTSVPTLDPDVVAAMIADAITRAATDETSRLEHAVGEHHRAYLTGATDDPTPPTENH